MTIQSSLRCLGALTLALHLLSLGASSSLRAAESGGDVLVIYNSRMEESKAVATYYAKARQVPADQVLGFDLPTTDTMTREDYIKLLQHPLTEKLVSQKLWTLGERPQGMPPLVHSKFRYAVTCYGVPFRVAQDPSVKEANMDKVPEPLRHSGCAVDGQLCLLPWGDKAPWVGIVNNVFYGVTNTMYMHPTNGLLLVTRLDGPSSTLAKGLVDKAMEAETNGLWGRAYFDTRGITNGPYLQGDEWIRNAARVSRQLGFETVLDEQEAIFSPGFPMSHIAFYAGWYNQDVAGALAQPQVEFVPGAFAYHLHSFSAQFLRDASSRWVGPLLAKGATITMGCVDEPFLALTPDVTAFFGRLVFFGNTFGESAYACQAALSWQTTAIGDPLYQPFGRKISELEKELAARGSPLVAWSSLMEANQNIAAGADRTTVLRFLQKAESRHSPILQEKVAGILLEQKRFNLAIETYEEVLKRADGRGQKLRILFTLGDLRSVYGPDTKALEAYQTILKDYPDYPEKAVIYQKLIPIARRLGKKDEERLYTQALETLTAKPPAKQ